MVVQNAAEPLPLSRARQLTLSDSYLNDCPALASQEKVWGEWSPMVHKWYEQ